MRDRITNIDSLHNVLNTLVKDGVQLCRKLVDADLQISTVCILAQSYSEYAFVLDKLKAMGKISEKSHGLTTYFSTNTSIAEHTICLIGVRKPDSAKNMRGYVDFPVADLNRCITLLHGKSGVVETKSSNGIPLLELRDASYDVVGYIIESRQQKQSNRAFKRVSH